MTIALTIVATSVVWGLLACYALRKISDCVFIPFR